MTRLPLLLTVPLVLTACWGTESTMPAPAEPSPAAVPGGTLQAQLEARKAAFADKAPEDVQRMYEDAIAALAASGIVDKALGVGATIPAITLPDARGHTVSVQDLLKDGPVVITWYRGGWCPYCNLTLRAWTEQLDALHAAGGQLVAITPETPDNALSTAEKNGLPFTVLSDTDNAVARAFGTVFEVPAPVWDRYRSALEVRAYYAHDRPELPLATTYVVDTDGVIRHAFLSPDYRERAEPSEVIAVVQGLTTP